MIVEALDVTNIPKHYNLSAGEKVRVSSVVVRVKGTDQNPVPTVFMRGILPKCKKDIPFNILPILGRINLRPSVGRGGEAYIHPLDYRDLILEAPLEPEPDSLVNVEDSTVQKIVRQQLAAIIIDPNVTTCSETSSTFFKTVQQGVMYNPIVKVPS